MDKRFEDIVRLIKQSRANAIRVVNAELISLYWNVGAYIKQKLSAAEWCDKTVEELAVFIQKNNPELKGFSRRGLYRMIQFMKLISRANLRHRWRHNYKVQKINQIKSTKQLGQSQCPTGQQRTCAR